MKFKLNPLVALSAVFAVAGMVVDSLNEEKMVKDAVEDYFKKESEKDSKGKEEDE